jgi:predicted regulator of Ras-like GTPase activity (Roadblock/LC7/MglB family)
MGLQGNIHDMSVADLIQHNCDDRKKAQLSINHNGKEAAIYFMDGNVVHASLGAKEGEEVVYEILGWEEGTFSLNSDVDSPKKSIERSWGGLLMEGAKRLDEQKFSGSSVLEDPNQNKEVINMAGKIEDLLQEMSGEMNGLIAATIAGMDGINIAQYSNGKVDLDAVTGQLTIFVKLVSSSSEKAKMGTFEDIILQTDKDFVMCIFLPGDNQHFLTCIVDRKDGSLGNMRLISKVYSERFSKIIPR